MRIVSNDELRPHVDIADVFEAYERVLREYYRGDAARRPRVDVWSPTSNPARFFQWGTMEGLSREYGVFVTRMKSDIAYFEEAPDGTTTRKKYNTRKGAYCGLLMAFDVETGAPRALVHDSYLQRLRVGAHAGLAVREGALEDASVVGVLGSGGMARTHLAAFDLVRDLDRAAVFSPTRSSRREFAREMDERLDLRVESVDTARAAVEDAHVVACCTDATEPVLETEWLADGAFVTTVKARVELPDDAWERIDHLLNFSRDPEAMRERQLPRSSRRPDCYTGAYECHVAGDPSDYETMPEQTVDETPPQYDLPLVQVADVLDGSARARTGDEQVLSYGGPSSVQGLQFAAAGGLACVAADEHDLGHVLPNELLLEAERN